MALWWAWLMSFSCCVVPLPINSNPSAKRILKLIVSTYSMIPMSLGALKRLKRWAKKSHRISQPYWMITLYLQESPNNLIHCQALNLIQPKYGRSNPPTSSQNVFSSLISWSSRFLKRSSNHLNSFLKPLIKLQGKKIFLNLKRQWARNCAGTSIFHLRIFCRTSGHSWHSLGGFSCLWIITSNLWKHTLKTLRRFRKELWVFHSKISLVIAIQLIWHAFQTLLCKISCPFLRSSGRWVQNLIMGKT